MAAVATSLGNISIWERFQRLAKHHIEEGNLVAGERLWEIVPSPDPATVLTIRSTRWAADSVECAFDAATGALTCAPGPAIAAPAFTFHVLPDSPGMVRRGGVHCSIADAVQLVLDELVWTEEPEGELS